MALISIIVPVYNVEKYLVKCIESLIGQTLKDIEIILVNDGSTDQSGDICDKYKIKDKRIKVIHKKNGGLSDARNTGIDIAIGKYIAFVDSDDWVDMQMFKKMYEMANKNKVDIVQCNYIEAYDENNIGFYELEHITKYTSEQILEELYGQNYVKTVVVWNKIYKRELFEDIRFPKGKLHEDEFTIHKILYKAKSIIDTNVPMYYYRQRADSIMNSKFSIKRLDLIEALEERRKFFKENKLNKLVKLTERNICGLMKYFNMKLLQSDISDNKIVITRIKNHMKNNYFKFMFNPYISNKSKLGTTIYIINEKLYYKIYGFK